jgi:uncharacterized membrane protein YjgN (DUF898 family)
MTRRFSFSLAARRLFPLFIGFYLPFLFLYVLQIVASRKAGTDPASSALYTLVCSLGILLLELFFVVPFLRRLLPAFALDGKALAFGGSVGRFVGLNLLGAFLSIITLGIYAPWYIARLTRYVVGETSYQGTAFEFSGRGGRLFVILLLSLVLPVAVLAAAAGILAAQTGGIGASAPVATAPLTVGLTVVLLLLVIPAYVYLFYRWFFVNLRVGAYAVGWNTRFWPACGTILLQMFLTLITLGVYFPAAYVKLYRYFAGRTVVFKEGEEGPWGRVGCDGATGEGFLRIWGQMLLVLVTAGFYTPWALARIGRWYAEHSFLESPAQSTVAANGTC